MIPQQVKYEKGVYRLVEFDLEAAKNGATIARVNPLWYLSQVGEPINLRQDDTVDLAYLRVKIDKPITARDKLIRVSNVIELGQHLIKRARSLAEVNEYEYFGIDALVHNEIRFDLGDDSAWFAQSAEHPISDSHYILHVKTSLYVPIGGELTIASTSENYHITGSDESGIIPEGADDATVHFEEGRPISISYLKKGDPKGKQEFVDKIEAVFLERVNPDDIIQYSVNVGNERDPERIRQALELLRGKR